MAELLIPIVICVIATTASFVIMTVLPHKIFLIEAGSMGLIAEIAQELGMVGVLLTVSIFTGHFILTYAPPVPKNAVFLSFDVVMNENEQSMKSFNKLMKETNSHLILCGWSKYASNQKEAMEKFKQYGITAEIDGITSPLEKEFGLDSEVNDWIKKNGFSKDFVNAVYVKRGPAEAKNNVDLLKIHVNETMSDDVLTEIVGFLSRDTAAVELVSTLPIESKKEIVKEKMTFGGRTVDSREI